jgi:hypothetical protein
VGVSAALIPFLEHDDANRALMGSNMQRQAVPLIRSEPPIVATGMEKPVAENSGMVVKARKGGIVTFADAERIVIDNADEYELRKFNKLNERACLNQKPIVKVAHSTCGVQTLKGLKKLRRSIRVTFPADRYDRPLALRVHEHRAPRPQGFVVRMCDNDRTFLETPHWSVSFCPLCTFSGPGHLVGLGRSRLSFGAARLPGCSLKLLDGLLQLPDECLLFCDDGLLVLNEGSQLLGLILKRADGLGLLA